MMINMNKDEKFTIYTALEYTIENHVDLHDSHIKYMKKLIKKYE